MASGTKGRTSGCSRRRRPDDRAHIPKEVQHQLTKLVDRFARIRKRLAEQNEPLRAQERISATLVGADANSAVLEIGKRLRAQIDASASVSELFAPFDSKIVDGEIFTQFLELRLEARANTLGKAFGFGGRVIVG